jgi:predicted dinucleotide-binding enzyme
MQIGIIGAGDVGTTLARGLQRHGHQVKIGTRSPEKLRAIEDLQRVHVTSIQEAASESTELLILAVKGSAAMEALRLAGRERLEGKIVIDATNPLADVPPEQGVLTLFTERNQSLMETLQSEWPEARFVKAFNSVGAASMIDPHFDGVRPTMFICGNDPEAKQSVRELFPPLGWDAADMGSAVAARAIEPLSVLWCIPGFRDNEWTHAFKLLRH